MPHRDAPQPYSTGQLGLILATLTVTLSTVALPWALARSELAGAFAAVGPPTRSAGFALAVPGLLFLAASWRTRTAGAELRSTRLLWLALAGGLLGLATLLWNLAGALLGPR